MGIRGSSILRCEVCGLHDSMCMCAELPRIDIDTQVVVFAHAHDINRPSNTGRLVAHMLSRASLIVHGARDRTLQPPRLDGPTLVLHPDGRALRADDIESKPCLLVPDGTWAQARHMLQRIEPLRAAERVSLTPRAQRKVVLRRQTHAAHMCTLEAVATALGVLGYQRAEALMMVALEQHTRRSLSLRGEPKPEQKIL